MSNKSAVQLESWSKLQVTLQLSIMSRLQEQEIAAEKKLHFIILNALFMDVLK